MDMFKHVDVQFRAWVVMIGASLPAAGYCSAQDGGVTQTATLTVTRRLVVVDAEFTDKKTSAPVHGLTAADVTVFEDGQERPIDHFEEHFAGEVQGARKLRRIFVLDALNSPLEETLYAENSLRTYFEKQPETLAEPASVIVLDDRGLHTLAAWTTSRDTIVAGMKKYQAVLPSALARGDGEGRVLASVYALRQIALANTGGTERNSVVWVGRGFPSVSLTALPQDSVDRLNTLIENLTANLLDARVTLSRVDTAPAGTAIPPVLETDLDETFDTTPEPFEESFSFVSLIQQTGGRLLYNRNDVTQEVGEAAQANASYYTIAYTPSPSTAAEDIYRHLRLVVHRAGVQVQARRGYFTHPPELKALPTEAVRARMDDAVTNTLAYTGLSLTLRVAMRTGEHQSVSVASNVPAGVGAPGKPVTFHVAVARFDAKDKPLSYTHSVETKIEGSTTDEAVVLSAPADGTGKAARIRIIVLEPITGEMGSIDLSGANMHGLQ